MIDDSFVACAGALQYSTLRLALIDRLRLLRAQ